MKSKGLVSVIMNCHNGEAFLKEAIESVVKQKYKKWELIFWDNNSKDASEQIFKSFKDKRLKYYFRKKKVSLYESRNSAIKKAKGEFIAFLDQDDIWFPNKLSLQIKKFSDPNVGLVYGKFFKINENSFFRKKQLITAGKLPEGYITKDLLKDYKVGLLTIMLRKKFLNKAKIFKTQYNFLADLDFVLRFSLKYKFAGVQEVVGIYRQHENQMQEKYFKEKSVQFSAWYKELISKNMFGGKKNLGVFEEWERFYSNLILVKTERGFSVLLKIMKYPNNINKIKLFLLLLLPETITKKIISLT
tara:strand:- start:1400 stop:2305 length:906 start_codon:yes stop_codon:yes gene_type:complete